jgi:protein SCO1
VNTQKDSANREKEMRIRTLIRQWSGPHARTFVVFAAVALGVAALPTSVVAHSSHHDDHGTAGAKHGYVRTVAAYIVPDVNMVDADAAAVPLRSTLASEDRPVILNFIFTSCSAVCPVMSATFAQVQAALGAEREAMRMVSISIDPEQDTPAVLKAYAGKFGAGRHWQMLTGSVEDSIAVQRAFAVYRGDKMNHQPVTFLRAHPGQPWLRLDGFASAADILREYRQLRAK